MLYVDDKKRLKPLTLDSYQRRAARSDQNKGKEAIGLRVPLLGLFGETGSLLTLPKRKERETSTYYRHSYTEEFGDVLWYISNLASRHDLALSAIARVDETLLAKRTRALSTWTFRDVQKVPLRKLQGELNAAEEDFLAMGAAVGRLLNHSASRDWDLNRVEFGQHLARVFQRVVSAATNTRIDLNLCAHNNLAKINSRWPASYIYRPLFDARDKPNEQLPRRIVMYFEERNVRGKTYVFQTCRGINIGDRLTDNRTEKDDYRFHDVFHLAYAAILGWSPVMRALFQVKRKSKPSVDENQDGARAILIEEGVATWIFNHGLAHHLFRGVQRLDYTLLKAIRHLTTGYDAWKCPLWQWQDAILEGFRVFRELKKHRHGWIIVDVEKRWIDFSLTEPRVK